MAGTWLVDCSITNRDLGPSLLKKEMSLNHIPPSLLWHSAGNQTFICIPLTSAFGNEADDGRGPKATCWLKEHRDCKERALPVVCDLLYQLTDLGIKDWECSCVFILTFIPLRL